MLSVNFSHTTDTRKWRAFPSFAIRQLAHIVLTENAFCLWWEVLQADSRRCHGVTIYTHIGQYLHVEMGERFHSSAKWTEWNLCSVSNTEYLHVPMYIWGHMVSLLHLDTLMMSYSPPKNHSKPFNICWMKRTSFIRISNWLALSASLFHFLDVHITNNDGQLITSAYYKDSAEPYIIPFKSDHPRHTFGSIVQAALARALRYSSTPDLFNAELRNLRLTMLYNGWAL